MAFSLCVATLSRLQSIMTTKESKRIVKTYNRVARALIEFEMLWHQGWVKSIENAKAGLQATLIVRHPESGKLLVNFDKEIMQLMRETKYLQVRADSSARAYSMHHHHILLCNWVCNILSTSTFRVTPLEPYEPSNEPFYATVQHTFSLNVSCDMT